MEKKFSSTLTIHKNGSGAFCQLAVSSNDKNTSLLFKGLFPLAIIPATVTHDCTCPGLLRRGDRGRIISIFVESPKVAKASTNTMLSAGEY
jgi:hypothetical protein